MVDGTVRRVVLSLLGLVVLIYESGISAWHTLTCGPSSSLHCGEHENRGHPLEMLTHNDEIDHMLSFGSRVHPGSFVDVGMSE